MIEEPAFITIPYQEFKAIVQEVQTLRGKINALEAHQTAEIERLGRDIAYDRQRLKKLENAEFSPTAGQKNKGDMLIALVMFHGGTMPAKEARLKMAMDKGDFSRLLYTLKEYIRIKKMNTDKRCKMLEYIGDK